MIRPKKEYFINTVISVSNPSIKNIRTEDNIKTFNNPGVAGIIELGTKGNIPWLNKGIRILPSAYGPKIIPDKKKPII